jgi:hypothetical protein
MNLKRKFFKKFLDDLNVELYHKLKPTKYSLCTGYIPISKRVFDFFKKRKLNNYRYKPFSNLKSFKFNIIKERKFENLNTIVSIYDFDESFMIKAIDSKKIDELNLKSNVYLFKFKFRKDKDNIKQWTL